MPDLDSLLEYNEIIRKMFDSEEEGFQFYNLYAKEKGFSVRRSYVEWDNTHNEMTLRKFVCSCQGFREEKNLKRVVKKRKPRNITRGGCLAKFVIAQDQNTRQWYVKDFIDEHNHRMAEPDLAYLLRSHRRINDEQKADILDMQISGIGIPQIMDIMEKQCGGYDKVGFTIRDLYNFCHSNKVKANTTGDAQTVISFMTERQHKDVDFFFKYMTDKKGHLEGLFWCDSQCRLDYTTFGDVVMFDSTYKTNRYNLPLVSLVGVNHHGSTILFACAVISQETTESFVWLLQTFSAAMNHKHPVSVITGGDRSMHRAIRLVWPNSSHRLCSSHIDRNIVRNLKDDEMKDAFRCFLNDVCSIDEIEQKWLKFLDKYKVTDKESWLYQMYEMRELWCVTYHVGKCYLGLRSNQRSESLNSMFQVNLDHKMTLLDLVQHFDHCHSRMRKNEAYLDCVALNFMPLLEPDASILEKEAAKLLTPTVFLKVQYSIKASKKCFLIEELDGYDTITYIVGRKDKGDIYYYVDCEICVDEGNLKGISCSCHKLQSLGTPCSHIFFVLGHREERELPDCCVLKRWTKGAKSAFPAIRKSTMYDCSDRLQRYRELCNMSEAACFAAASSPEAYEQLKQRLERFLHEEAAMVMPNGANGGRRYAPTLPLAQDVESAESINFLDSLHVPSRGALKKNLKSVSNNKNSKVKCTLCKGEGHNRRTCSLRKEETKLSEDVLDI